MNVFVRIPHDRHANRALLTARDRLINTTLTDNKANALRKKDINKQILTRICFEVEKETNSIQCNIIKLSLAISNKRHKTVDYWLYCKKKQRINIIFLDAKRGRVHCRSSLEGATRWFSLLWIKIFNVKTIFTAEYFE